MAFWIRPVWREHMSAFLRFARFHQKILKLLSLRSWWGDFKLRRLCLWTKVLHLLVRRGLQCWRRVPRPPGVGGEFLSFPKVFLTFLKRWRWKKIAKTCAWQILTAPGKNLNTTEKEETFDLQVLLVLGDRRPVPECLRPAFKMCRQAGGGLLIKESHYRKYEANYDVSAPIPTNFMFSF